MKNTINATLKVIFLSGLMLTVNTVFAYEGSDEAEFSISSSDYVDDGIYTQENEYVEEADFYISGADYSDRQQSQQDDLEADFYISSNEYIEDKEKRRAEAIEAAKGKVAGLH